MPAGGQGRRRERRRGSAANGAEKPAENAGVSPSPLPDGTWPEDPEKNPALLLVVNLDGSACVAIDPEREKELHAVQDPHPGLEDGEPAAPQRGTVRVGRISIHIRSVICGIVVALILFGLLGMLYALFGTERVSRCRPVGARICDEPADPTPAPRKLLGVGDAA
ncbi:unnamed protein product [Pedinophyceae sp. YPF-701]|nr:unnamed protein product [Pedinophyceae sp. YPF-701]